MSRFFGGCDERQYHRTCSHALSFIKNAIKNREAFHQSSDLEESLAAPGQ